MSFWFKRRAAAAVLVLSALFLLASPPTAWAGDAPAGVLPRTLTFDPLLKVTLQQMLATSPTFRHQCDVLDRTEKLVVLLHLNPTLPRAIFRARATMRRYSSGLLVARIEVAPGNDQAQWIGHEFEHVLEQLDGHDLETLESHDADGVWPYADGMIETRRAYEAGRRVWLETRSIEVPDKFVE
jgi:hypothetical protein